MKLGSADPENFEVFAIEDLTKADWRRPIVKYLENPTWSIDRKVKYRSLSYIIIGNKLFNKTPECILLKCLSESEAYLAVSNVHSRACGAHQVRHKMRWLSFWQGVYWHNILKDCIEFAKGCQECQVHSSIQHVPASELHAIAKPWPFRGWHWIRFVKFDQYHLKVKSIFWLVLTILLSG